MDRDQNKAQPALSFLARVIVPDRTLVDFETFVVLRF